MSKHRAAIIVAAALMALFSRSIPAQSKAEKDAAVLKYKGKFLVVKKDGIEAGPFVGGGGFMDPIVGGAGNIIYETGVIHEIPGEVLVRKGDVLTITNVHLVNVRKARNGAKQGGYLDLVIDTLSPHAVTRGVGAFAHQIMELGRAYVVIYAGPSGVDFSAADGLAAQWFTLLAATNPADAAQLGNTASGVFVNQVKSGMSFAEVESALGLPLTRVDLGEKVLYKYKDMTVEFRDGRVADVR
jgi:hypothetical protein